MPRSTLEGRAQGGASLGLFALLLFGALRFLQGAVPLSTGLAVLAAAGAGAVWWAVRQDGRPGWLARGWRTGAAGLLAWVAVRGAAAVAPATLSSAQSAYVIGAGLAGALAFGALRRSQAGSPAGRSWTENLRLFLLIALAAWLFQSFLSSDFYGRVDARSYAYSMIDALSQERAGHLPVFVGQTEFMFNGSVHPMRTAPYHYILGMLLDLLTGRALTPVAIEHLTVLVTAVQAALTCYLCLAALAPDRRWLAWLMAALYVSAPAPAAYLHGLEMYMTFMTFAFLPLVLMENVRLIRNDGGAGWVRLASALALVWLCHAPVALWLTLCTVALQGLRLMTRDFAAAALRMTGVAPTQQQDASQGLGRHRGQRSRHLSSTGARY